MEASQDPFGQEVATPEADPFASADGEFQQGEDPFAEVTEQPRPGVPVVGADGEVKDDTATQVETDEERIEREGAEAAAAENEAEFDRVITPDPTAAGAEAASSAAHGEADGSERPGPTQAAPATEPVAASPASEAASAPAAQTSPTPASATATGDGNGSEEAADGEPPREPEPEEPEAREPETDAKGTTVKRPYLIFAPDGKGKWREVTWWEDKDGKIVPQGTDGAKKQNTAVVRGQEEALRAGYRALGSPPEGVKIVAVAANYFRLRQVEPDVEPQPRVRLKIR